MEKKLRKSIYIPAILAVLIIASFGCKDEFFDSTAGDRITPDQHYKSIIDAQVSIFGAFAPYQDIAPKLIMLDGVRSDMMELTPNADTYLKEINDQNISANNPYIDAADLYKVIINVNEVLLNIDKVKDKDKEYDELTAFSLKGALIGLRAYTYLQLVRLFNKAAYFEDNMVSIPANHSQNILGKEEILAKLIAQLEEYFTSPFTTTKYPELRLGFVNNKAILGELYLEVGRYADAATYLKLACESYQNGTAMLKVDKSYKDAAWGSIFLNAESQTIENIAVVPYSRAEGQFNPLASWLSVNSEYLVKPSSIVIDSFMAQIPLAGATVMDVYRGAFTFGAEDIEMTSDTTFEYVNPFIRKYAVDVNDLQSSDIILSRAADLHLLLAEAYNRMGDKDSQTYALMLLNQGVNSTNPKPAPFSRWSANLGIRGRAYLKSREVPARDSIPLEERTILIEDLIIAERAMELAFEGKRWFDLVRIAERRNDPAYLADRVAAKFAGTSQYDAIRNKLMNPANWYLPSN